MANRRSPGPPRLVTSIQEAARDWQKQQSAEWKMDRGVQHSQSGTGLGQSDQKGSEVSDLPWGGWPVGTRRVMGEWAAGAPADVVGTVRTVALCWRLFVLKGEIWCGQMASSELDSIFGAVLARRDHHSELLDLPSQIAASQSLPSAVRNGDEGSGDQTLASFILKQNKEPNAADSVRSRQRTAEICKLKRAISHRTQLVPLLRILHSTEWNDLTLAELMINVLCF
ncbi:hypothetical protein PAPYR_4751 [Paratrimastix pyriformis]|uniref:Uncharacterized protein n=1 Tax=Paratrimastix pyriformis TaxID=342808 RepID=A0ABQ8UR71_9EUKA|nr:hypothetical protein PAPYR_4751 [Paratrimastix pyriformis]